VAAADPPAPPPAPATPVGSARAAAPSEAPDPAAAASGFEEEEETSPEVVRQRVSRPADELRPVALVGSVDGRLRKHLTDLLRTDGWNAIEAQDAPEVLELALSLAPQLLILDQVLGLADNAALAAAIRHHRPDAALRTVAHLGTGDSADVRLALGSGFDDFLVEGTPDGEILARAAANLRAARTLALYNKQRRDASLLLELSQTLASSLDMQLILHTVSRLIAEVIALERCSIILLDPNDDDAIMVAASEDRAVRDLRIRLTNYPEVKRCVETGAPVLIADVECDPLLQSVSNTLLERGVRTMALFPIVYEEAVTGVLFLRSSKPSRRLTDHEVQFGQTVASACAVAIRNARLFDQFRDQNEHIQSMRAQAERQNEALRKYQDFFEYAADGISVIDGEGRIVYANKEGRRLLGRTRDELMRHVFQEFLIGETAQIWPEVVSQVRHGSFKRSFDVYVDVSGEERVFSLSAGGVGMGTGLLILSFRDVTETREMEGELRTTKDFLENLIDNSMDAIVAGDMNGRIMLFNKGAERVYGYRAEDVIGRMHVNQLYPRAGAAEVMRKLRDERWGGKGRLAPERREIRTASGETAPVSMTASIIYEDGEEVATVGVFTDLRDRMAMERQLSEAREELTKAEKARVAAELAGMAAHELNQPLTSVLGYAEMLKARVPEDATAMRKPVEIIFKQAERMAEIVRKIGRITKYETKRYGGRTDMIDLNRAAGDDGTGAGPTDTGKQTVSAGPHGQSNPPQQPQGDQGEPSGPYARFADEGFVSSPPRAPVSADTDPRAAVVRLDTIDEEPVGYARRLERQRLQEQQEDAGATPPAPAAPTPEPEENTNPGVRISDLRRRRDT
jgi:PAS domain S-box-containing protein